MQGRGNVKRSQKLRSDSLEDSGCSPDTQKKTKAETDLCQLRGSGVTGERDVD